MRFAILISLALFVGIGAHAEEKKRPNFLIIYIDDLGYGDLSCYGNEDVETPHIDKLASQGMRMTSFYAQPVCGPSRGSLMTGRQPQRVGGGWKTNSGEVFISEILKEAGYTTGCVGKWDMSQRKYQEKLVPNSQGFDYYYGALGANDANKVTLYHNREKLETTEDMAGLTKLYTDKSIEFLEEHKDDPFFLYLAHTMMHVVIDASPKYRDSTGKGLYADTLVELDAEVGRLLKKIDELGLAENTVVLFISDNGPWSNDHERQHAKNEKYVKWTKGPEIPWGRTGPLRGAKGTTWEGGMRVPGIVRWPGHVPEGSNTEGIVSIMDVMPTFTAIAGASDKVPTDKIIDGVNQMPLWLGKEAPREELHYYHNGELQAIRKGGWKLRLPALKERIKWANADRGSEEIELYNLAEDIGESKNLAKEMPEKVEELMKIAKAAK